MNINSILSERGMSKYRLSKDNDIPYTTINDICSGKTRLEKCSAETIYKLSKQLNISMEALIESALEQADETQHRDFEVFKSSVCHKVKDMGDIDFIIETLETDDIRDYYNKKWYAESFYLLAMLDYLSRENELPLCTKYNDIRAHKLAAPLFPASIIALSVATKSDKYKEEGLRSAIPEFKRFNIIECDVRDVT